MKIASVKLKGFRNFSSATINFSAKTLVIGANDVGKTNLLRAIRLLLDKSIAEVDLEPKETDFHIAADGVQADIIEVEIKLSEVTEDAVISRLKGHVSEAAEVYLSYIAERSDLKPRIFIGHSIEALEETDSRFYLKHIHFKYIESRRDIHQYIQHEKRYLTRIAKEQRSEAEKNADAGGEAALMEKLASISDGINQLNYVKGATSKINHELGRLSHHHVGYEVRLESQALEFSTFVDRLTLGASASGRRVGLGGDGRNNQILVGLWKAKSEIEHDAENEAVIYCIEEPEAHLHPHQQRKLANYLVSELKGQVLVTTHSPQIASEFQPDGIIRLVESDGNSRAASDGCSACIEDGWRAMGYRMSVLPAQAFFADVVFLVEGPSEVQFYHALASQLNIDLDYYNITILSVDGIAFKVHVAILSALEVLWVARTDNDVALVPKSNPKKWQFQGLNRARKLAGLGAYAPHDSIDTPQKLSSTWSRDKAELAAKNVYLSKVDLEHDLAEACPEALIEFANASTPTEGIAYLQAKKAIRMGAFLHAKREKLAGLRSDPLSAPLLRAVELAKLRRPDTEEEIDLL